MKQCGILLILSYMVLVQANAQETVKTIQQGNDLYKQQQFDKAEATYKQALDMEQGNTTAKFNRANAMTRQGKQSEAMKELDELAAYTDETDLKGKSYYNKGVILSGQKRLEESIEAYKNALRQNPADKEARENLQKALLELKKRTPPPPPKKDNKKKNDKQKKQQPQPKMNEKEAEQRLKLLEQKEKELQQRLQKQKTNGGGGQPKDW
jgi:Ca-activated chloride channel homolog